MQYLVNAWSPSMLKGLLRYDTETPVYFKLLTPEEVEVRLKLGFVNALGHKGVVDYVNKRFKLNLTVERKTITLGHGDSAIIIMPDVGRLPPGTELNADVMEDLEKKGLIMFIEARVP